MWLNASASDGENGAPRRPSHSTLLRNGVKNRARELRSAATVLPARLRGFFADLGPGLVTGAADDDPSGISTYSVAGASFGYAPLWTAIFSFPLMVSVQLMCARLGMVAGRGLAGVVRRGREATTDTLIGLDESGASLARALETRGYHAVSLDAVAGAGRALAPNACGLDARVFVVDARRRTRRRGSS